MRKRPKLKIVSLALATMLAGCGGSQNFVFTGPLAAPPVAVDDTVAALGNAILNQTIANGVLNNDTINGATITEFDASTAQGGTVVLNEDGSFQYTAPFGFTGSDSFTYTLSNDGGSSTATVTLNIDALAFFVDNSGPNGNGSQSSPFDNLSDALAAVGSGDTIFVYRGDGLTTKQDGSFTLPAGVNLIGQAQGLVAAQTIEVPGGRPVLQGPITLGGDNLVAGLRMESSTGVFLTASGVENLAVDNNEFSAPNTQHILLTDVGGTLAITNNVFEPHSVATDVDYVEVNNTNTDATIVATANVFNDDAVSEPDDAFSMTLNGTSVLTATFQSNTFSGEDPEAAFEHGIGLVTNDSSRADILVDDNSSINAVERFFSLECNDDSAVTASITGNTADGSGKDMIRIDAGSTITTEVIVSGNVISGSDQSAFDIDNPGSGSFRALIENNDFSASNDADISINFYEGFTISTAFIRSNTLSGQNSSIDIEKDTNLDPCVEITGNTVSDDMVFRDERGTGSLRVEQFDIATGGPLTSINTFLPPAGIDGGDVVTAVLDNTCGAP